MAVVVIVEAPQRSPARYAKDRLDGPGILHHLDLSHASPDALIGGNVKAAVVSLAEAHATVRPSVPDALKVDQLVPLDRFSTALALPATHLYDDIHESNLCPPAEANPNFEGADQPGSAHDSP